MKRLIFLVLLLILFSFSVNAQRLRIDIANQDPNPVRAGEVVEVTLKIENTMDLTDHNTTLEIIPEFPFSLYASSPFIDIGRIDSREVTYKDFKLKVDNNAADGKSKFTIKHRYKDDKEDSSKYEFFINVEKKRLEIKPYIVASDIVTSGNSGKFTIEIANVGRQNIQSLELELSDSTDYKLLSTSNYIYIGDLEADDTESEDFSIYVNENLNNVNIPIKLKYEVNDEIFEKDFNLVLNLLTKEEAKKVGLIKNSYTTYIIIIILVLIAIFFLYRKFRKKW